MPEMPEVEIIRRGLEAVLPGRCITNTEILLPRQIKWPTPDEFTELIKNRVIKKIGRKGKYLIITLEGKLELIVHLRMTGRLVYCPDGETADKHLRVAFHLDNGALLAYGDIRTFGELHLLREGERQRVKGLFTMGPEPLTQEFTPEYLEKKFKTKRMLKTAILDQHLIGGLGNIYADEALFLAKLMPSRLTNSLGSDEILRLHTAVNSVIRDGIADGGTTFRDYQNAEGKKGSHQEKLFVYQREGKPCRICGHTIKRINLSGRGTHYCPHCQGDPEEECHEGTT